MTKTRLRVSPGAKPQAAMSFSSSSHLLPLSAHSPEALRAVAQSYKHFLADEKSQSGASLEDICYTVANHRSHHDHRLSITADDKESCLNCLDAFLAGQPAAGMTAGRRLPNRRPKIAFLFTGQGSQYVNMGRQLYETQPVFRQTLQRCDELLRPLLDKPLLSVLYPSLAHQASIHTPQPLKPDAQAKADADSPLNQTAYTQPALFALEYSVAQQWRAWGVEPDIVIGHSVGEYVAACVAGVFSLETGLKLIAERGRLMQQLPADGAMASVFAGLERVQDAIGPREQELSLAAINGPEQVVISGKRQAVQAVLQSLEKEGIAAHPLNVSHAFHSPLMEPILRPLEQAARQAQCTPPQIKLISNLTGQLVDGDIDAAYWRRHARQPVQFAAGMQALQEFGCDLFIEIGPHPALMGMVERVPDTLYLPSLRRGGDDCRQMLESLGAAYVRGVEVNWASLYEYVPRRRVSLPAYPFQRERYWWDQIEQPEAVGSARPQGTGLGSPQLPRSSLLGGQLHAAIPIYQTQFDQERLPWVDEHRVCEFAVVPGTVWLEMALAAAKSHTQADAVGLQQVEFRRMLLLAAGQTRTVQLILTKEAAESAAFEISSILENAEAETSWSHHARGRIVRGERLLTASAPLSDLRFRLREQIAPETFYDQLRRRGLHYGPAFQGVKHLWRRDREALGRLELPEDIERQCQDYQLHPVLLGTAFQLIAAALPAAILQAPEAGTFVPVGLADLCFYHRPRTPCWCYVFLRHIDAGKAEADLRLLEDNGQAALEIAGLQLEALPSLALQASNAASSKPETPAKELPEVALDLDGLQTADAAGRHALLQSYLRKQLAGALGLAEAKLDVATPLHRFGLDSIMVFKLGMRLERDLRVKLKMADLIDGPSVAALATMVLQKMTQA